MATFEEHMAQLETVVGQLERGDLGLEESLRLFEEGMRLTSECRKELDAAEGRLQVLVERPGGGMVEAGFSVDDSADLEDVSEEEDEL